MNDKIISAFISTCSETSWKEISGNLYAVDLLIEFIQWLNLNKLIKEFRENDII